MTQETPLVIRSPFKSKRRRLAAALGVFVTLSSVASAQTACDLDGSGSTNVVDVTRAVNMVLGVAPCTANVEGPSTCSIVTIQRVVNAALGQTCITYTATSHSVSLNWNLALGAVGYNVYRSATSGGAKTKINSALALLPLFTDNNVIAGQTYYYTVTSVDLLGTESGSSNQAMALVPTS